MKKIIILLIILLPIFSYSQPISSQTTDKGLTEPEFLKAKEDYLKMSKTDLYKEKKSSVIMMADKLGDIPLRFAENEEDFAKYIKENLSLTKFSSVKEAVNLRKRSIELEEKIQNNYAELFKTLIRATNKQRREIIEPDLYNRSRNYNDQNN